MGSWLNCCRIGIGTEGVGGVFVILFKNHSESENNWFEKFTAEVKIIHYILFFVGQVNEQIPTREMQTRDALYFSS